MSESKKNNNGGQVLRDKLNMSLKQRLGKKGELAGRPSDASEAFQRAPSGETKTEREREFMRAIEQDAARELEQLARTELFSPSPSEPKPEPVKKPAAKPEPAPAATPIKHEPKPEPKAEPKPEPKPEIRHEPKPEPQIFAASPAPAAPPAEPIAPPPRVEPAAMDASETQAPLIAPAAAPAPRSAFEPPEPAVDMSVFDDAEQISLAMLKASGQSDSPATAGSRQEHAARQEEHPASKRAAPSHDHVAFEALARFDLDWIEAHAQWADISSERQECFLIFALPNPYALGRLLASGASFNKKESLLVQTAVRKKHWASLDLLQKQGAKLGLDALTSVAGWRRQNAKASPPQRLDAPPVNIERKAEQLRKEFAAFFDEHKGSISPSLALFLEPLAKSLQPPARKPATFAERHAAFEAAPLKERSVHPAPNRSLFAPSTEPASPPLDLFEKSERLEHAPSLPPPSFDEPRDEPPSAPPEAPAASAQDEALRDAQESQAGFDLPQAPQARPDDAQSALAPAAAEDPFADLFHELDEEFDTDTDTDATAAGASPSSDLELESDSASPALASALELEAAEAQPSQPPEAPDALAHEPEGPGADAHEDPANAASQPPADPGDDEPHGDSDDDSFDTFDNAEPHHTHDRDEPDHALFQDDDMTAESHDLHASAEDGAKPLTSFAGRPARPPVSSGPSALDRARLKTLDSVLAEKQALEKRVLELEMYAEAVGALEEERDSLLGALEEAEESARQFESAFGELQRQVESGQTELRASNEALQKQLEQAEAKSFDLLAQLEAAREASAGLDAASKAEVERLRQAERNLNDLLREAERREVEAARREAELNTHIKALELREPPPPEAIDWLRETDREKQLRKHLFIENIIKGEARTLEKIARNTSVELDLANLGLVFAAEAGQIKCAEWLISEMGVDIHFGQELALLRAMEAKQSEMVFWLIERGANLHHADEFALRMAAREDNVALLDKLVAAGANPHCAKQRPLREALAAEAWGAFKALLAYGANPHDDNGQPRAEFAESEQAMELIQWAAAQRGALKSVDASFSRRAAAGGLL